MSQALGVVRAVVIASTLLLILTGCPLEGDGDAQKPSARQLDQSLLTAYELLEEPLGEEAKLGMLEILKKITCQRPVPEIEDIVKRLSDTSKKRLAFVFLQAQATRMV